MDKRPDSTTRQLAYKYSTYLGTTTRQVDLRLGMVPRYLSTGKVGKVSLYLIRALESSIDRDGRWTR